MKIIRRLLCVLLSIGTLLCCCVVASAAEPRAVYLAVLTIFASSDGVGSSALTEDHAFISIKNTSSQQLLLGGLNVNPGHEITIGTWLTKPADHTIGSDDKWPSGVFLNAESHLANYDNGFPNRVSLSINVTMDDLIKISDRILSAGYDVVFNNCATFARKTWNCVAPVDLQLSDGFPNQPVTLYNNIKKKSGYQVNRPIMNITPVGYVNGKGNFVSVSLSCSNSHNSIGSSIEHVHIPGTSEVI